MSDGCESHAFECSKIDDISGKWSDPNKPYPKFFTPLLNTLIKMKIENSPEADIKAKWKKFLMSGTQGLKNESDDKTMILAVFINQSNHLTQL